MKKKFLFLLTGFFILSVILMGSFVLATSYNLVSSSQTAKGGETVSMITFNVSNSTGGTGRNLTAFTVAILGTATSTNVTNVTLSDGTGIYYNDSITGSSITIIVTNAQISSNTNFTVNFTINSSAAYSATLGANVTTLTGDSNVTVTATPFNSSLLTITESTAPTATATCSPIEGYAGEAFPCTCTGTDSGASDSGVASSTGSSNSPDGISTPTIWGTFIYTCTVKDNAGNTGTAIKQYTILSVGGGGSGGASTIVSKKTQIVESELKSTPGAATIFKDFNPEIGIKEIQIEVNNEAQNVKVTVTKYDGKPAKVTQEKTGKVYQYLEIKTQNLGDKLDKATVTTKVEKSWTSTNGVDKNNVVVSKFDETAGEWNELNTVYNSEDDTYYYYNVELTSFSFFAIGEKAVVEEEEEGGIFEGIKDVASSGKSWLWILIALVVLAVAVYYMRSKK